MRPLIVIPLVLQGLVPIGLFVWLAFGRESNRTAWLTKVSLIAIYIVAITRVGLWLALPWYLPRIYGVIWLAALLWSWPRVQKLRWKPPRAVAWLRLSALDLVATFCLVIAAYSHAGTIAPIIPTRELRFPLRGGTYTIAGGGSNTLLNPHLTLLRQARARAYHGQGWAIDIVKAGRWGSRHAGIAPRTPERYAIFGEAVFAPCSGVIVTAVGELPDLQPPQTDRVHMAGNHVIIACADLWVVMAHLQKSSLVVETGDAVREGQSIARVGNSGNTDEPHLHIHAQTPGTPAAPMSGNPVPIRLDGKFLARNDRVNTGQTHYAQQE